jgi:Transcription activator MBF2
MKFVLCFALLALAGFVACTNSTWGFISPYDVVLHYSIRKRSSSFLQIVSENVTFPFPGQKNNQTITAIRLTDQVRKGKAYGQIYAGGPGFNHTTIRLKSERNQGYNFILEIYGRR